MTFIKSSDDRASSIAEKIVNDRRQNAPTITHQRAKKRNKTLVDRDETHLRRRTQLQKNQTTLWFKKLIHSALKSRGEIQFTKSEKSIGTGPGSGTQIWIRPLKIDSMFSPPCLPQTINITFLFCFVCLLAFSDFLCKLPPSRKLSSTCRQWSFVFYCRLKY